MHFTESAESRVAMTYITMITFMPYVAQQEEKSKCIELRVRATNTYRISSNRSRAAYFFKNRSRKRVIRGRDLFEDARYFNWGFPKHAYYIFSYKSPPLCLESARPSSRFCLKLDMYLYMYRALAVSLYS